MLSRQVTPFAASNHPRPGVRAARAATGVAQASSFALTFHNGRLEPTSEGASGHSGRIYRLHPSQRTFSRNPRLSRDALEGTRRKTARTPGPRTSGPGTPGT